MGRTELFHELRLRWLLTRIRHARKYDRRPPAAEALAFSQTVYLGYDPADLELLNAYRQKNAKPEPGFVTDFIGVRTRVGSLPSSCHPFEGQVLGVPWPKDFLAEAAEWVALCRAIEEARESFTMMELGAGWGPWIVGGGHLARRRQIENIFLLGIEADESHFATMEDHFRDNGFDPSDHRLLFGAAGTEQGRVQFAIADNPSETWGHRPIASDPQGELRDSDVNFKEDTVGGLPLREIPQHDVKEELRRKPFWDLIHIDIQGWEAEIVADCLDLLGERVRRIVVGTHSRQIEARLLDLMHGADWRLEGEKPCRFNHHPTHREWESMTVVDGVQVWSNPRLSATG
jgi:hypothetical protein